MRIRSLTRNRAAGLGLAAVLVGASAVALAPSSQAVAAAVKLSVTTGSTAGGTVVTITGKNFENDAGTSNIGRIQFNASACTDTVVVATTLDAATKSVISPTKITITTPALPLTGGVPTKYFLCLYNSGNSAAVGTATFTAYTPVTINSVSPATGPSFGGTKVTVVGDDFTTKTSASIGGKLLAGSKVTVNAGATDDTLTGTLPAGIGLDKTLTVRNEGGAVNSLAAFDYQDAIKVSPAADDGTINDVISITGVGFQDRTFNATTAGRTQIALVAAGTALPGQGTVPTTNLCNSVQVESDTELSCQLATAVADGAYSVRLIVRDATNATLVNGVALSPDITAISKSATYTVSDY